MYCNLNNPPLITNKLVVNVDKKALFAKYSIISYRGNKNGKNLSYERLSKVEVISIAGLKFKNTIGEMETRFFVLTDKEASDRVLESLDNYSFISKKYDNLEDYNQTTVNRIVVSLALNSLGMEQNNGLVYNDSSLIVCDPFNFFVKGCRKGDMVCLGVEVNKYLNLCTKTITFKHPNNIKDLKTHLNCVFVESPNNIGGNDWMGKKISRISLDEKLANKFSDHLDSLYIRHSSSKHHNLVFHLPTKKEQYNHGKLFITWEIYNMINEKFKGIIEVTFKEYEIETLDEKDTAKQVESLLLEYFNNKHFCFIDPFKTNSSKEIIKNWKEQIEEVLLGEVLIKKKDEAYFQIKLCQDIDDGEIGYSHGNDRNMEFDKVIQHLSVGTKVSKASARRILMELLIKDSNRKETLPSLFSTSMEGWTFYRFKQWEKCVYGCKMSLSENKISFQDYGFSKRNEMYNVFLLSELRLLDYKLLLGSKDYMALKRGNNVYLIIDTDEIPMFNSQLIDEVYGKMSKGEETIKPTQFKNKGIRSVYINGFIGLTTFRATGLNGTFDGSVSYLAGHEKNINSNIEYDKMPRVKTIFCLSIADNTRVSADIQTIIEMLKFGFGRYHCSMAYPIPFKFILEHLDSLCESTFSCHWNQLHKTLKDIDKKED